MFVRTHFAHTGWLKRPLRSVTYIVNRAAQRMTTYGTALLTVSAQVVMTTEAVNKSNHKQYTFILILDSFMFDLRM